MSKPESSIQFPLEIEAALTPAVKAFALAAFAQFEERIKQLEDQIEELTPRYSSLTPSAEHSHAKPARKVRTGKRRKKGGQPGHQRQVRELILADQSHHVIVCQPDACRRYDGEVLIGHHGLRRHQVWDLPPIEPVVTDYQPFHGHCTRCGIRASVKLPQGLPQGHCVPRLVAFTGLLMARFRQRLQPHVETWGSRLTSLCD